MDEPADDPLHSQPIQRVARRSRRRGAAVVSTVSEATTSLADGGQRLAAELGGGSLSTKGPLAVLSGIDLDLLHRWERTDRFGLCSRRRLAVGPVGDGPTDRLDVVWWRPPSALDGPVDEWEPLALQWWREGPGDFGPVMVGYRFEAGERAVADEEAHPPLLGHVWAAMADQGLRCHHFDGTTMLHVDAAGSTDHWDLWLRTDEDLGRLDVVSVLPDPVPEALMPSLAAAFDDLTTSLLDVVTARWPPGRRPEIHTGIELDPATPSSLLDRSIERAVAVNVAVADEMTDLLGDAAIPEPAKGPEGGRER